jgi:hypothetical protein
MFAFRQETLNRKDVPMKWLASALTVVAFAACSNAPVFEVAQYSSIQPFDVVLAPGEQILVDDTFTVAFTDITEDSRCPIDAVCVWMGNAAVVLGLTAGSGPTHALTLNTGVVPNSAAHSGYRIRLVDVDPKPVSSSSIQRREYRAKLHIEAVQ